MTVGPIQSFKIEDKSEADSYLTDLLKNPRYRSMNEVLIRAQQLITDDQIKSYFVNKAEELLKAY